MTFGNIFAAVFIVLIVIFIIFIVKGYAKKLSRGCCSSGDDTPVKKIKVKDKNVSHYPYTLTMNVDGMVCENCKKRIENSLNSIVGVWAKADTDQNIIIVHMKQPVNQQSLRQAVIDAGPYTVLKIN